MLFSYQQQTQRLLRDQRQTLLNPDDLKHFINRARREVAMRTQSIRLVPPTSGAIVAIHVTNPGSGYTNPTVVISAPDYPNHLRVNPMGAQATATALVLGGAIASVSVTYGGDGYQIPSAVILDPTGSGATLSIELEPIWTTIFGQEQYNISDIPLGHFPGVSKVFAVRDIQITYANYTYGLPCYPWSTYMTQIRQFPQQYIYVPTFCTRFCPGTLGAWNFYPLPSTIYPWHWDCLGLPIDLEDDQSVERVPEPYTDAVPYMAAAFGMEQLQNYNAARYYQDKYDQYVKRYAGYAQPGIITNPYGGW